MVSIIVYCYLIYELLIAKQEIFPFCNTNARKDYEIRRIINAEFTYQYTVKFIF